MNGSCREEVIRGVNGIIKEKDEQNLTFQKYAKFFFCERGYQLPGC